MRFHFVGSGVEIRGAFKLWVNWIQLVQPPTAAARRRARLAITGLVMLPPRYGCGWQSTNATPACSLSPSSASA
jgi:hypothetical protein